MKDMFTPPFENQEKTRESALNYINSPPAPDAAEDEEFWKEVLAVKPRKNPRLLIWGVLIIVLGAMMCGYAFALQHGRGLLRSLLPAAHGIEFTLPIAETPELEAKYLNPDGSYNAAGLAKAAIPTVVQIKAYKSSAVLASSQGSGIVMSEDGYILTNAHVISGAKYGVTVLLYDKSEYAAQIVGSDDTSDIAVLKISAVGLTPAQFADSDKCELGEEVVAIGSPAGFENSVTKGIISGLDRQIRAENSVIPMQCIQIDAAINPGNSGGPLFNMWGQVVGITSSKLVSTSYDNIGFAITVNSAKPIIEELIEVGYVPDKGRIGIVYSAISDQLAEQRGLAAGLLIQSIDEECPVAQTEREIGDIITEIGGVSVSDQKGVNEVLTHFRAGEYVVCKVFRPAPDDDGDGQYNGEGEYFEIEFKLAPAKTSMIEKEE